MLIRTALSAYITSFAIVIYYALLLTIEPDYTPGFDTFMQWTSFISLYVFPIVLIYGSFVSISLDFALKRWVRGRLLAHLLSVAGHVVFGFLFGLLFRSIGFMLLCGASALLFWLTNRLLDYGFGGRRKKAAIVVTLFVPLLVIVMMGLFWRTDIPPLAPFTEEAAVQFATSGEGTEIDLFPKAAGASTTEINGYTVTRETSVKSTAKERYDVSFREKWSNNSEEGNRWYIYSVGRDGMALKESGGAPPPY